MSPRKLLHMLLTAYALSPAAVYADPPLFCLGPCTSFHINSAFEERYEENIFRDPSNEKEDYASILSPGAYLQFGNHESANSGTLFFREDFFFYAKNSKLDHEEANVFFSWQSCFARSNFNLDASYIERYDNTPDANVLSQLIRTRESRASIHYHYCYSPKTYFELGFDFSYYNYRNKKLSLTDRYVYALPLTLYYCATPKLDIGPSYRFSFYELNNKDNFTDHFLGLALRGEISSKLCATANLGASMRKIEGSDESTTFSADIALKWNPTCKIGTYIKFIRLYDASAFGPSVLNTGFDCGFTYEPICNLTLYGDFIYNNANYRSLTTREDDSYEAHARLAYVFCRYYEFSVGYNYQENDSTNAGSKYRNQIGYARIAFKY